MERQSLTWALPEKTEYDYEYRSAEYEYDKTQRKAASCIVVRLTHTILGPAGSGYEKSGMGEMRASLAAT